MIISIMENNPVKTNKYSFKDVSLPQLEEIASNLALAVKPGDVVTLKGNLGAGKSTFSRFFIRALLGVEEEVPSPTFTLVQIYQAKEFFIWHFDLYRIKTPYEVYELGIEDAFNLGISLIEWADIIEDILPLSRIEVNIEFSEDTDKRNITVIPYRDYNDLSNSLVNEDIHE